MKNIYNENFIWELLEANYFDIDELCEVSKITKFEIIKAKLKKDKENIDRLFDLTFNKNKNYNRKISKDNTSIAPSMAPTQYSGHSNDFYFREENAYEDMEEKSCEDDLPLKRKAKSFMHFEDSDFEDVDYLFHEPKPANKKKKKKKAKNKDEGSNILKRSLIKNIKTMSTTHLSTIVNKVSIISK